MKNGRLLGNGVPRGGVGVLRRRVACCSPIEARLQETKESLFALSTLHCNLQRRNNGMGWNESRRKIYKSSSFMCVQGVCVWGGGCAALQGGMDHSSAASWAGEREVVDSTFSSAKI